MFLIWGSRGFEKVWGNTVVQHQCPNCHNTVTMQALEVGKKFTFFFIPLFKTSRKYYLACPICRRGKEMDRLSMMQYLPESTQS